MGQSVQEDVSVASVFPLGPYHPALPEPIWYQLRLRGETIASGDITAGYCHRGVEALLARRSIDEGLKLAEHLCGSAAHHHRLALCLALERLAGVQPPPRASVLRSLFCEVERLLSHLSWAAQVARAVERPRAFYAAIEAHERIVEGMEAATGQRLLWGLPIPGGVSSVPDCAPLAEALQQVIQPLEQIERQLVQDRGMQRRTRGLAVITEEQARQLHLTGPVARASGSDEDARRQKSYDAYADLALADLASSAAGDTHTRIATRITEMRASIKLTGQLIEQLPDGPLAQLFPATLPSGEASASVEGPQGCETWQVCSDGSDHLASVSIITASQRNLAAVPLTLEGQRLSDALLILASLDLCIACVDK
jgi:Ni,Fe-hydrogenase III large subunit